MNRFALARAPWLQVKADQRIDQNLVELAHRARRHARVRPDAGEVHLHAGSLVEGDVTNETISVENGAQIYGSIRRANQSAAQPSTETRDSLFQTVDKYPSLDFRQDNALSAFEDNSFRPIKVVRPR